MRERFNFVGPDITPKEEVDAAHSMAHARKRENVFHEAELEKTPGELAAIGLLNDILEQEFLALDIVEIPEIRPERFHIMSEEWFDRNKDEDARASYTSFEDKAVFSRARAGSFAALAKTIFHEGIHASALQKHWVDVKRKKMSDYRLGYGIKNVSKDVVHRHFGAFSEGVTELTVQEMFHNNGLEIRKKLGISQEELAKIEFSYPLFRAVVRNICHGLSQFQENSVEEAWKKIKRGQFTGEMMHLRDIEYAYGKGALRLLDALEISSGVEESVTAEAREAYAKNELVQRYFENHDRPGEDRQSLRASLAREILGNEEYQKYCQ